MDQMDAQLSHALLNPVTAALQGEVASTRAIARLTRSEKAMRLLEDVARLLDQTREWWKEVADGVPLVRKAARLSPEGVPIIGSSVPELTGDGQRACEILEDAIPRWQRLSEQVERLGAEAIDRGDAEALQLLVSVNADRAFYAYQMVTGTIAMSKIMGDAAADGRGAGRVNECMNDVRLANAMVDQVVETGRLEGENADQLAGRVLALPIELRLRIAEARRVLGLMRDRYDYAEAGIPEAAVEDWRKAGVPPSFAAQWFAAGFSAPEAIEWARARIDPLTAGVYRRQGVTLEQLREVMQKG